MDEKPSSEQKPSGAHSAGEKSRIHEVGNFEIISKLGQGGMGAVYKVRQKSMDRIVALKVLPPSVAKDEQFIERFQGEARASAKLNHPHIVKGIDVGQDPATKLWYFAMEFIDGPSLQTLLKKKGKLEEKEALKIIAEIASALECVAAAGMAHRDIKPDNILLTSDGHAKLADLGLAKDLHDDAGLTLSGQALGTPKYMSPEQVRGDLTQIDIRSDIYSLGATLFYLVTGEAPFTGETSAVIMSKHLTETPTKANAVNAKVSAGCTHLIERMMQKKIEQRVQTPTELIKLINKVLAGENIGRGMPVASRDHVVRNAPHRTRESGTAKAVSVSTRPKKRSSMSWLYVGSASLVTAGAALAYFAFYDDGGSKKNPNKKADIAAFDDMDKGTTTSTKTTKSPEVVKPSKTNKSDKPITQTNDAPNSEQKRIERLVSAARAFEDDSPNDFEAILKRYAQLENSLENSPLKEQMPAEFAAAIKKVHSRREEIIANAWSPVEEAANTAVQKGDYDTAIKAIGALPNPFNKILAEKAASKITELNAEADSKLTPIILFASQSAEANDFAAGVKALETVAHIQYTPLSSKAQALKAKLTNQIAETEERERLEAERILKAKFEQYLIRFDQAIVEESDAQKARSAANAASRDSELKVVAEQVKSMVVLVDALEEAQRAEEKATANLPGKPFAIGTDTGTIEKVEDGIIHVAISLENGKLTAKKKVPVKELTKDQRTTLLQLEAPNNPAAKVVAAMQKLSKEREDLPAALALIDSAGDFPLAGRYREIIRVRQVGVTEAAAEKAWSTVARAAIKPCENADQGKVLLTVIEKFQKEHGQTQFVKTKEPELSALWKKANSVIDVKVYLSDLQEIEVSVGYPKFGKSGDLGYEGQRIKVYGTPSPNGISTHPPTSGQSHVAYMLEGRFSYFTTRVAVNDSCGLGNKTAITFKVLGDGKLLWQSQPVQRTPENPQPPLQECVVDVNGVAKLELIVDCPGTYSHAHAVWVEPLLGTGKLKK